jgi:serine/threonine-protein kinase HipA
VLVCNTDDHLRNHGFILAPGRGWRLSGAYDMNPVADSQGLKLNISEADNAMDLELVRSVAPYFRLSTTDANEMIKRCKTVVSQWPKIAVCLDLSTREQERMASAFRLAD